MTRYIVAREHSRIMTVQHQRIVHMIQAFVIGGGESLALQLARHQLAEGHDVNVVALESTGPMRPVFEAVVPHVYQVERMRKSFDPSIYARLLRFFYRYRPTVVHTHDPKSLIYAAAPARAVGATLIHTKHGVRVGVDRPRQALLMRGTARFVNALVAVSDEVARVTLRDREAVAGTIHTIRNGVDLSRFENARDEHSAVRAELGIPQDARVVGTVGRVVPVKDHSTLLRAMEPHLGRDTHLVIVGEGDALPEVRAHVDSMREGRSVHLLGARQDIPRLMGAFDIFALSSVSEGLPMVILEAYACKLPVVSTDVGGVPAVVRDGVTGLTCPVGDPSAMADRLGRLLADPDLARSLGGRGYELVRAEYSMGDTAKAYMDLYRRARNH